jgi:prevent-host-death family protein
MTTRIVNTHEAKSRLSELIRAAEEGVEVILARNGQPVARIVPWRSPRPSRTPGAWRGEVSYRGDIVGPDDEVAAIFAESADGSP